MNNSIIHHFKFAGHQSQRGSDAHEQSTSEVAQSNEKEVAGQFIPSFFGEHKTETIFRQCNYLYCIICGCESHTKVQGYVAFSN